MLGGAGPPSSTIPQALEGNWVSAVSLTRRMPPKFIDRTIAGIQHLCPRLRVELLTRVDRRLGICFDPEARKYFVACGYNQHGSAFRSPWSNTYIEKDSAGPAAPRRFKPADNLRHLESAYNQIFDAYRHTYYEGGVSSVYLWSLPSEDGFAAAFVLRHALDGGASEDGPRGCWESTHVAEVTQSISNVYYRLTSTVILSVKPPRGSNAHFYGGAMMTRTSEQSQKAEINASPDSPPHIGVIGPMIETMEESMRTALERCYFAKAFAIIDDTVQPEGNLMGAEPSFSAELRSSLSSLSRGLSAASAQETGEA